MNSYETILKQIQSKLFSNLDIALMAIMYWIIKSPGMSNEHIADIMTRIGFTFDISAMTLNDGTNTYTVLQMLQKAISDIYTTSKLSAETLSLIIDKCYTKEYITPQQAQDLINSLATATEA